MNVDTAELATAAERAAVELSPPWLITSIVASVLFIPALGSADTGSRLPRKVAFRL